MYVYIFFGQCEVLLKWLTVTFPFVCLYVHLKFSLTEIFCIVSYIFLRLAPYTEMCVSCS